MSRNYYGSDLSSDEENLLDYRDNCEVEDEDYQLCSSNNDPYTLVNEEGPYSSEPLADEEWLEDYNKEREKIEERNKELQDRFDGVVSIDSWCRCGNCRLDLLQNPCESQCCTEIDACMESLKSELVSEEVEATPICVTLHPGFSAVCLNRWSLRSSAVKYKTMDGVKYRQLRTEAELLRATAYREYSQLINGYLGPKRLPLPACVYDIIRKQFHSEEFHGYEDND